MARRPLPGAPGGLKDVFWATRASQPRTKPRAQTDELHAAGCAAVYQEHGSGASRLGSVSHLLDVIERLEESGAHFRSLRDPIDNSTPQGMFSL